MISKNYFRCCKMRKIWLGGFLLLAMVTLAGCDGNSGAVQIPDNPVPMPDDIVIGSSSGEKVTLPKK